MCRIKVAGGGGQPKLLIVEGTRPLSEKTEAAAFYYSLRSKKFSRFNLMSVAPPPSRLSARV
jgi:hypothetical protein